MAKYQDSFCDMLIEHMAQGFSYDSFPAYLHERTQVRISVTAMYQWEDADGKEMWKEAKLFAQSSCLYYFEKLLKAGMIGAEITVNGKDVKIDRTLIIFTLKTRFHKIYGEIQKHALEDETLKEFKLAYNLG